MCSSKLSWPDVSWSWVCGFRSADACQALCLQYKGAAGPGALSACCVHLSALAEGELKFGNAFNSREGSRWLFHCMALQ